MDTPLSQAERFWGLPLIAILSLVRRDGRPHATPVKAVYLFDEHQIRAAALVSRRSVKAQIIGLRQARGALTEQNPQGWVSVEGPCHLSDDLHLLAPAREAYELRFSQPSTWGDIVVIVAAEHIYTGG